MSKLTERLREGVEHDEGGSYTFGAELVMEQAAERIEHLERVLVQAREALHSCVPGDYSTGHVIYPSFDNDAVDASIAAIDEAIKEKPHG